MGYLSHRARDLASKKAKFAPQVLDVFLAPGDLLDM
jgi:hypothetical protein